MKQQQTGDLYDKFQLLLLLLIILLFILCFRLDPSHINNSARISDVRTEWLMIIIIIFEAINYLLKVKEKVMPI